MTNREKIHRAFDALQLAEPIQLEEKRMNRFMPKRSLVALCAAILVLGSLSIAYAADLGGFRETLTVWFGGKKQEASVQEIAPGVVEWTGEDGESHLVGGVAYDNDGNTRPVTMEEIIDSELSGGPVLDFFEDEGTVFLEFYENYVEVTDQVASGRIEAHLEHDGVPYYITFVGSRENGWHSTVSTEGFAP